MSDQQDNQSPRTLISVNEVAASLHVSTREVIRMAEEGILPARRTRGQWQFRAGDIWNWIEANLHALPLRRSRDPHPPSSGDLLLEPILRSDAVAIDVPAKTKASILRELASMAAHLDTSIDRNALVQALQDREAQGSTALQDGVAIPHPQRPLYSQGPILAAARTAQAIGFGERGGGLTDLFFLICCPTQVDHLLYLGRLCRLLLDRELQTQLRGVEEACEFADALVRAEKELCRKSPG